MAQRALVDTTVLYAAGNRSERRHEIGRRIVHDADHGILPRLGVTDVVLVETLNGLQRDVGHRVAVEMLNRLEQGAHFLLTRESKTVRDTGREIFRAYDQLSLADAIQVALARSNDIRYIYSFDSGFDSVDELTRLASPENPFKP